ncbi:MAG TPA: carboxypeptidase-like regulatory domain-containing protein [Pyrinomonadaceae bacterium]|nr:carboxypeptidase-like regulatory domain-containing protein [Pyrinomonadaceae bacterium]
MNRTALIIICLLLSCVTCFGQSSYRGLTPGQSTRADVERVLGQPVNKVSATLIEYRAQPLTDKIYVQYRQGSTVVERIEVLCRLANSTCEDLIHSLNLRLPAKSDSEKVDEEKWKFLYGAPRFIVTSGVMADVIGDSLPASRLAFYSRELYEAEFVRVGEANKATITKAEEDRKTPPVPEAGQITGIVKLNGNPVAGATVELYRTDGLSGHFETKTDRYGIFIWFGGLSGTYVAVASGAGMKWTYVKGLNIPVASALEVVAEPGDGARPTQAQVMAAIR